MACVLPHHYFVLDFFSFYWRFPLEVPIHPLVEPIIKVITYKLLKSIAFIYPCHSTLSPYCTQQLGYSSQRQRKSWGSWWIDVIFIDRSIDQLVWSELLITNIQISDVTCLFPPTYYIVATFLHIYYLLFQRISYSRFRYQNMYIHSAFESAFCRFYILLKEFFLFSGMLSAFPLWKIFVTTCVHLVLQTLL